MADSNDGFSVVGTRKVESDDWAVKKKKPYEGSADVERPTEAELISDEPPIIKKAETTKPKTKEELQKEYNAQRTEGQLVYGSLGAGAGSIYGLLMKAFPEAKIPPSANAEEAMDIVKKFAATRNLNERELADRLSRAGINVSSLDRSELLSRAVPMLEQQLGTAEAEAARLGSSVKPTINIPPSITPDIADIIQHSAVLTGDASSLARETGQHEMAHQRSQAGKQASSTAQQIAAPRGSSYTQLISSGEPHMPTPSGRVLVPQMVATDLEKQAIARLEQLGPARQQAEALIRQLKSEGKDVSALVAKINELSKQESVALQMLQEARKKQPGALARAGYATSRAPFLSSTLGGGLSGLSAYNLKEAAEQGTPPEFGFALANTLLNAASMVPPVGYGAPIRGIGTVGSLAMAPLQMGYEYLKRKGILPSTSVMDKVQRPGELPQR
jgi:hypothetical protein